MKVSELAKAVGVNPQTVRYYEKIKLLDKPIRLASGYRDYGPEALKKLRFILEAKEIGFTLAEISSLLSLEFRSHKSCDFVRAIAESKLVALEEKLESIKRMQKSLRRIVSFCAESKSDEPCPVLEILGD